MKILVNVTYYYPHWTGLTQYAIALSEELAKLNHQVTILTAKYATELKDREIINKVDVVRCKPTWRISRSVLSWQLVQRLAKMMKETDVALGFLPLNEALWLAVLGKIFKKKVIFIYNGDLILQQGLLNRIIERVYFATTKMAIQLSDGIVVNTMDYASCSDLLKTLGTKWRVLVPPIKISEFDPKNKEMVTNKIGPAKFIVGFSGRFVEEKGWDILLKAIPEVTKNNGGVKFVFAGQLKIEYEKTYEKNLSLVEKAGNKLVILGKLSREEMMGFYKCIDLLVVSSRSDFFPFVQAEAMLSGVPIVVTDIPGARWLVKTTGAGIIVKPEDSRELAGGIEKALKNLTSLKKNTEKSKKIFNIKKLMTEYDKLLRQ